MFQCIVQSYLQWLQDSDYDPTCRLCGKNLNEDECGDCVRLTCYGKSIVNTVVLHVKKLKIYVSAYNIAPGWPAVPLLGKHATCLPRSNMHMEGIYESVHSLEVLIRPD